MGHTLSDPPSRVHLPRNVSVGIYVLVHRMSRRMHHASYFLTVWLHEGSVLVAWSSENENYRSDWIEL